MNQLAFDLPIRSRSTDPDTSHTAAERVAEFDRDHFKRIAIALRNFGPMGKDAIAQRTGLTGVQVARRLPEMQEAGLVDVTGEKTLSATGRPEREWKFVDKVSQ